MEIKVRHKATEATVQPYADGLEDGFATVVDVVTNEHIFSDDIIQVEKDGVMVCPYIKQMRGRTFIKTGDYVIIEADGHKHVVSSENLWNRFEKI